MTKVRTSIRIDETILSDFRKAVMNRYGTLRNHMSEELGKALKDRTEELSVIKSPKFFGEK